MTAPGILIAAVNLLVVCANAATYYVDDSRLDDTGVATNWATAKKSIQAAVDSALDGDTVLVTNGTYSMGTTVTPGYSLKNRVVITNNIIICSVNGPAVTIIEGSGTAFYGTDSAIRCVYMSKGRLEGFTLQNGTTLRSSTSAMQNLSGGGVHVSSSATDVALSNCIIRDCKAMYGGGSHYGTLNNCKLSGNTAYYSAVNEFDSHAYGGGSYYGTLNNCTLSGNKAHVVSTGSGAGYTATYGGGSYYGTLNNCILSNNTAASMATPSDNKGTVVSYGGGSYCGTLNNCIVSGNAVISFASFTSSSYQAFSFGGGSYEGTLNNCTVTKNTAESHNSLGASRGIGGGVYNSTLQNCIVWNNTGGASDQDNHYESTFVFSCTVPLPTGPGNIDSDPKFVDHVSGDLRLRHGSPCLDAGANEYASFATDLAGNPRIQNGKVEMGAFEGSVSGPFIDIKVQGAGSVNPTIVQVVTNGASVSFTAQTSARPFIGFYTNGVFASSDTNFMWTGISANGELSAVFETRTWHVNASRPDELGDGLSWSSAKKTIQAAVDSALAGDTVLVTNGTYNVGAVTTPNFSLKNRLVITKPITVKSVYGASVTTITGSGTSAYGTVSAIRCVYMSDGILDGFTLQNGATYSSSQSANFNDNSGGGVCAYGHAEIRNCLISSCKAVDGAGLYYGTLTNCTLNSNTATGQGGGACQSMLNACTLTGNAAASGGGAYYSTLHNCTLTGNTASSSGGGTYYGMLYNCTLTGNTASYDGGGVYYGKLYNCTLKDNTASRNGGGSSNGTLYNCTLTGNAAGTSGSGSYYGELVNCIIWENRKSTGIIDNYSSGSFSYSCTTPLPSGLGNVSLDPLFCGTTDYRLQLGSPCLNAGSNGYVFVMTDLNGEPRIQDGAVDMGAYEGVGRCAAPAFSPVTGRSYTNSVTVTLSCVTAGVSMRYTTDGSEPTLESSAYAGGFTLTNSTTIRAKAFKAGMLESETAVTDYMVLPTTAAPTFSLPSGSLGTNTLAVAIACATGDATIRYTLDGTEPTVESMAYTGALTLIQSSVIKAKAFKSGMADSAIATATYTVHAAAPVFDPPTGATATNSIDFSLSCLTEGVTIRYTTTGSEPTSSSTVYTNTVSMWQNTTVKAKAFKSGMADSATATAVYTVFQTVATPTFSPDTGTAATNSLAITLLCATSGSAIRYTLDGSAPTSESALYTGPVNLSQSATVKAKAFKSGMADSDIAEATFEIIHSAATPVFEPVTGTSFSNSLDVTITCATQDAAIRYTLDGSAPTVDSPQYAGAITLTKSATVQAKAFKAGLAESATASASYHCTILYVDMARPDDSGDGSSWQTAKRTIQAAITAAIAGDTVMVTNGIYNTGASVTPGYSVSNRVVITNAITLRSVNGADSTIIDGAGLTAYGTAEAIRCVYMSAGILDGFTLRNGATFDAAQSSSPYDSGGGGVCMAGAAPGAEVRNCVVRNCRAYSGGAAYQGALKSCTLDQNWASLNGGATYESLLEDCLLNANLAASNGGGAYYGSLSHCKLTGNISELGGGTYYSLANNCLYIGNMATTGGAVYYGTLNNCTITGNKAESGGGTYNGTYYNCIVWGNTTLSGTVNNNTFGTFRYSCMQPLRTGIGNIAADPLFVGNGDLSLRAGSPCLNKGNNAYVTELLDILGNARIQEDTVDMGAYEGAVPSVPLPEFTPASGTVFTNSLLIAITNTLPGAVIRYTLDGTEPNANSEEFTGALLLTDTTTVRAKAFSPGYVESLIATATYTEIQKIVEPVFSPVSGAVGTNSLSVTLTCVTPGVTIRYTLDGSEPDETSTLYGGPINLAQSGILKAKAFKSGMQESDSVSASYTVIQTVAAPFFSPDTGTTFTNSLVITLTCATPDAAIRYTLDGSLPSAESSLYTKPLKISKNTTICARAFKTGMLDSAIAEATYIKELSLAEAVDATNLVFATGGNSIWVGRSLTNANDTVDAAQSGPITDSQTSWMETSINGSGTLSFWWKTSCEDDPESDNWDFVRLLVDGIERHRLDGITDWQQITCNIGVGTHVIRWEYTKDESLSEGDDRAWVDQLSFVTGENPPTATTTTPVPVPYTWLDQYPTLLTLSGGDYEIAAKADVDGDGHLAWQEYVTGSIPTNRLSVLLTHIGFSSGTPWITWSPDMGTTRVYSVNGKTNLADTVWGPTNSATRFFKVKVDMLQ